MQDLTKLTTPICLLRETDPETAAALEAHVKAGGRVESYSLNGWILSTTPFGSNYLIYRAIPPVRTLDEQPFTRAYLLRWKVDFTGQGSPPQRNAWFIWDREDRRELPGYPPDFRWLDRPEGAPGQTTLQLED